MTDYQIFKINCLSNISEIVIAELADIGFEGFIENEEGFEAYMVKDSFDAEQFYGICEKYGIGKEMVIEENIPAQNWNAIWEADFEPIIINDEIVVKAPFHSLSQTYKHEIIIQPKNTFGTGHHETTQLVLGLMQSIDFKGMDVFDYGCGTGVLGFFAAQLGAKQIIAIDIDDWSADNVVENAMLNHIDNLQFVQGTLETVDLSKKYDVILANINKNILVSSFERLAQISKPGTFILISGFYESDLQDLIAEAKKHLFSLVSHQIKNTWCAAVFSV
jgi:ribosomal protein L11 methyltransferase